MINPYQTEEFFAGAIDIVAYILRTAERTQGAGVWCEFLIQLQRQLLESATKMGFGFNAELRKAADAHDAAIRQGTAREIIKRLKQGDPEVIADLCEIYGIETEEHHDNSAA
jgi:hypothetical protein